jgi:polar amino acid transport system substrate-binding protein
MNVKKSSEKSILRFASMAILAILLFCAIAASGQSAAASANQSIPNANLSTAESEVNMLFMLLQIQASAQGNLNGVDSDLANASQNLSETGLDGTAARGVLSKLLEANSNLAEAITFSKNGTILVAEGKGSKGAEEADLSSQENIAYVLKDKIPAFSKQFLLVEGYNGTALAYPVFSPQGEFIGGISAIIEPDKLLNALVAPELQFNVSTRSNITDYSFWAMELDGLIAYDRDESQIGKYLFTDPLYQPFSSLLDLGHRIVAEKSGHGYYSFQVTEANQSVVTKESYWTTVGLHSRELRLVVTKIVQ